MLSLFAADERSADRNGWPLLEASGACCKNLQLAETKDVTDILGWSQEKENENRNGVG